MPFIASSVLRLDPDTESFGTLLTAVGTNTKKCGATLAGNGIIYGMPHVATSVLRIDPRSGSGIASVHEDNRGGRWFGGILAGSGFICGVRLVISIEL